MSTVLLAHDGVAQGGATQGGTRGVQRLPEESSPALLISFVYLEKFLQVRSRYQYREWVLDSGAYSAHNSGTKIELSQYIDTCKHLLAEDPKLKEVFALDVIGDWRASRVNVDAMWAAGVQAIPCYHVGEPEHVLRDLARDFPKIALGGAVGYARKLEWAKQCFARVWPKRIHGFGFGSERAIMALPWHSVDATNWEMLPCAMGKWKAFGNQKLSVRGGKQNLRAEVEWYLALERKARVRWKREMVQLEEIGGGASAALGRESGERRIDRQDAGPTVELSMVVRSGDGRHSVFQEGE